MNEGSFFYPWGMGDKTILVQSTGKRCYSGVVVYGMMPSSVRFALVLLIKSLTSISTPHCLYRYPPDFAFDPSDEDEGEEDMLRQQLRKHLVYAVRQAPEFVLDFLCHALSSLPTPLSALPFPDLEAALRLIFHFGEGCGGMTWLNSGGVSGGGGRRGAGVGTGASELLRSGAFPQMVLALHESDVTQHKHPQVRRAIFILAFGNLSCLQGIDCLSEYVYKGDDIQPTANNANFQFPSHLFFARLAWNCGFDAGANALLPADSEIQQAVGGSTRASLA